MSFKNTVISKNLIKPFFNQKWNISKIKKENSAYWRNNPGTSFFIKELKKFDSLKKKTVLDLGCGDGRFTIKYAQAGFYVTGVDFSRSAIIRLKDRAKKLRLNNLIKGKVNDIKNISTPLGKFNGIACSNTLHYFNNKELKNVIQKMKDSTTFNGLNYIAFECEIQMVLPNGERFIFEGQPYRTVSSIKKLLSKYYKNWEILYINTTTNQIKASLPPLLKNNFQKKFSHYKRSFKVFDFIVINNKYEKRNTTM